MSTAFFRDYKINPDDKGEFVSSASFEDESPAIGCDGIGTIPKKQNPTPHLNYFCRVGGGYRGFRLKLSARNFMDQPD